MAKNSAIPSKKREKGRSNSPDTRTPRVATSEKQILQKIWRAKCLLERELAGTLTEKNKKEVARMAGKEV